MDDNSSKWTLTVNREVATHLGDQPLVATVLNVTFMSEPLPDEPDVLDPHPFAEIAAMGAQDEAMLELEYPELMGAVREELDPEPAVPGLVEGTLLLTLHDNPVVQATLAILEEGPVAIAAAAPNSDWHFYRSHLLAGLVFHQV